MNHECVNEVSMIQDEWVSLSAVERGIHVCCVDEIMEQYMEWHLSFLV